MKRRWKVLIVLSLMLNLLSLAGLYGLSDALLSAQIENIQFFQRLSKDQQELGYSASS